MILTPPHVTNCHIFIDPPPLEQDILYEWLLSLPGTIGLKITVSKTKISIRKTSQCQMSGFIVNDHKQIWFQTTSKFQSSVGSHYDERLWEEHLWNAL